LLAASYFYNALHVRTSTVFYIPTYTHSDVAFPEKYVTENFQEIFCSTGEMYLFIMSVWK